MKILFDQGTPRPLRHSLAEHSVDTAAERGWPDLDNGDLLEAAEDEGYDLLITTDQNIRHQQDLANRNIAILVLFSTAWPLIQQKVDALGAAANDMRPGELKEVAI